MAKKRDGKNYILGLGLLVLLPLLSGTPAPVFSTNDVVGIWWNQEKTSRIEVSRRKEKYFGKVIWLEDPTEEDGKTKRRDKENPDEAWRQREIVGLEILKNLEFDGDEWNDGEIYDPESGNTYSCYCTFEDPTNLNKLKFRGYMGVALLGRTTYWTRYTPD